MNIKFTTPEECQNIINDMKESISSIKDLNGKIQFPLDNGDKDFVQFNHLPVHKISLCISEIMYYIDDLQESLNKYNEINKNKERV